MGSDGVLVEQLEFCSGLWLNLHHVLYAAAWERRPGRRRAGALPAPLDGPLTDAEHTVWDSAVGYYSENVAGRDLVFDAGMRELNAALVSGVLDGELGTVLQSAAAVYERHFWAAHDRVNHLWIGELVPRLRDIGPVIFARLGELYGEPRFTEPVRVDVVWVANFAGGYTTSRPPHITVASADPNGFGWAAVEVVLHEASHIVGGGLRREFGGALGDIAAEHPQLWHAVLFYLAGNVVREALADKGIDYLPYMFAAGLVDRSWLNYWAPVESNWRPFLEGEISRGEAVARTVVALRP